MKQRILITGSEGVVGRVITSALKEEGHELVLLDKKSQNPVDLLKEDLNSYFENVETVIHLAVNGFRINEKEAQENLAMTWNVLENSKKAGVKRVINTSSINVYDYSKLYLEGKRIDSSTPLSPHSKTNWKEEKGGVFHYSVSKILGEHLIKLYNEKFGISGLNLRLGCVCPNNCPSPYEVDDNAIWLSHEDLIEIMKKAINFNGFESFVCVSHNSENFVDLGPLKSSLGYVPQSDSKKLNLEYNKK